MTPTEQDKELREAIYGLAFAVETHPDDFVLRINEKGVNELLALINSQALKLLDRLAEKRSILTVPEFNEKCIPVSALQEERKRYE